MRVSLVLPSGVVHHGWAANVSRGGIRVTLPPEAELELGAELEVALSTGADPTTRCPGRVVWVKPEGDGVVCGIKLVN